MDRHHPSSEHRFRARDRRLSTIRRDSPRDLRPSARASRDTDGPGRSARSRRHSSKRHSRRAPPGRAREAASGAHFGRRERYSSLRKRVCASSGTVASTAGKTRLTTYRAEEVGRPRLDHSQCRERAPSEAPAVIHHGNVRDGSVHAGPPPFMAPAYPIHVRCDRDGRAAARGRRLRSAVRPLRCAGRGSVRVVSCACLRGLHDVDRRRGASLGDLPRVRPTEGAKSLWRVAGARPLASADLGRALGRHVGAWAVRPLGSGRQRRE